MPNNVITLHKPNRRCGSTTYLWELMQCVQSRLIISINRDYGRTSKYDNSSHYSNYSDYNNLNFIIGNRDVVVFLTDYNHNNKDCERTLETLRKYDNLIIIEECSILDIKSSYYKENYEQEITNDVYSSVKT